MPHQHRQSRDRNKNTGDERGKDAGGNPFVQQAGAQIERVFDRANLHAFQTAHALVAPHAFDFVYFDARRTGFGAKLAIDASRFGASDFRRTQPTQNAEQAAVGTEITAPKVFDGDRKQHENENRPQRELGNVGEEKIHLYLGDFVVRAVDEGLQRRRIHLPNRPNEEEQQQIFERAQGIIQPAVDAQIAAEQFLAEPPQRFAQRSNWAHPTAKRFFEQQSRGDYGNENEKSGRMNVIDDAGEQPIFQTDERADWQKTFDAGRAREEWLLPGGHTPLHEEIELDAGPYAQHDKSELRRRALKLRIFSQAPPKPLVPNRLG